MWVARHQVGDFGLHLALIRSISWGSNFPPESPFFPGRPLPYHYGLDFFVGLLERSGIRIDYALNGVSALLFSMLLYLLWKIPQQIFGKSMRLGIISVLLFVFHSGLTFVDFLTKYPIGVRMANSLWRLPDYLNIGPFDGSLISTFFTLNVYLNQRHLIAGMVISLSLVSFFLSVLMHKKEVSTRMLIALGLVLGLSSRVHTMMFASTAIVLTLLCIFFRKPRLLVPLLFPAITVFPFHAVEIVRQSRVANGSLVELGFLSTRPFSIVSFVHYWWVNLFIGLILIPYGYFKANQKARYVFLAFASLFVVANVFRLSFRIDHNHSLLNLFFAVANMYIAAQLASSWRLGMRGKAAAIGCLLILTASGVVDIMVVKNDFRFPITDDYRGPLITQIRAHTTENAVFLAPAELIDPVALAGRKNYLGHSYYLTVMGYPTEPRATLAKLFFEAQDPALVPAMRKEGIGFVLVPKKQKQPQGLQTVFETEDAVVYAL